MKKNVTFFLAVLVLVVFNLLVYLNLFASHSTDSVNNREFPDHIAEWTGKEVPYDKAVLSVLAADMIVYKDYISKKSPPITLFIAYYDDLEKADLSHSPIVCFTGQGWEISELSESEIASHLQDGPNIRINRLIQKKSGSVMIALFWYQSAKRSFTNRAFHKMDLFIGKISGKVTHNAFVRVTAHVPSWSSVQEVASYLNAFVLELYPGVKDFLL